MKKGKIMKNLLGLVVIVSCGLSFDSWGQIKDPSAQEPCWKKSQPKNGGKYLEWECGKVAGAVNCNEKLGLDERSNTVTLITTGAPFSGICESCFSNGLLQRRVTFLNGKENGIDTTYYKSGCPQVVRNHIGGVENGTWRYFYDSTNSLAWEINYFVGEKHGKSIYLKPNGDTTSFEVYNKGLLEGTKKTYYSNGKLERAVSYKEGKFHGPFKLYSIEGNVVDDLNYLNGEKDGVQKYYYSNGVLLRTENWVKGTKEGEFKTFFIQGQVQKIENYRKGLKEGLWVEYFPNEKLKRKSIYRKDVLIEDHQFNEDGEEIETFGVEVQNEKEDDDMPFGEVKKRKVKAPKEKKSKKKKEKTE